ncbi:hypothetical protein POM88_053575 [Heracleum sosnowskyi]|uniref:Uncharacterized protein n=1 Tax=Heracleum sosnowskyi TaxID=360622 RepID=A0AAD8GPL6_9APIA|nr:hypothetical protein POM88_053575 [Heracleum sosnowskyi]
MKKVDDKTSSRHVEYSSNQTLPPFLMSPKIYSDLPIRFRTTYRFIGPWGSELLEAINSLKNVDSTALLQFLQPILNMLLHLIGNGGETLQVAKYLVPAIRLIPANGTTKPTCIHLITGIKAYSKILWLMDQQDLFTFIFFFLLLMSKKMMCI